MGPIFRTIVFAGAAFTAAIASAKVHEVRGDGFVVRDTVTVKASPRDTWMALTKPGEWWSDDHTWSGDAANMTLTPQGGGCFCERIPGGDGDGGFRLDGSVQHGTVVHASPLKMLRLTAALGPLQSEPATGVLTFVLKPSEGGTQIQMEYHVGGAMRFQPAEMAPVVDKVMSQQLALLGKHLGIMDAGIGDASAKDETIEPASDTTPDDAANGNGTIEDQIDALGDDESAD